MKIKTHNKEEDRLNTNELMNDYAFYHQMIHENKQLDFEDKNEKKAESYIEGLK